MKRNAAKRTQREMSRVISWCLYVDSSDVSRLPEYLVGLKCNQRAARLWFPGWELRLYVARSHPQENAVWEFVEKIAKHGDPVIRIIECDPEKHPMTERYRPFFDPNVRVCIVRDLDSILSKTDADLVNEWISDPQYDVLQYREYLMGNNSIMGGGVGFKTKGLGPLRGFKRCDKFQDQGDSFLTNLQDKYFNTPNKRGRNYDEIPLARCMLDLVFRHRWKTHVTRMTKTGAYYLMPKTGLAPRECEILWTVPFFDAEHAEAFRYPGMKFLETASLECIADYSENFPIRREHTGAHWSQHREAFSKERWFR